MAYIFLDESGDLGFEKKGSSRWFIFTVALTSHHRRIEKVIKSIRKKLRQKHHHLSELHAYHADESTRRLVLQKLASIEDLKILCIILNKKKVYIDLKNQKNYLYNYTANILLDRLYSKAIVSLNDPLMICIDRKDTNKKIRQNFQTYLEASLKKKRAGKISVVLRGSHEDKCLQAVDFISWAIFRKYEWSDSAYYELIKDKIIEENMLFA